MGFCAGRSHGSALLCLTIIPILLLSAASVVPGATHNPSSLGSAHLSNLNPRNSGASPNWTVLSEPNGPSAGYAAGLAYDVSDNETVLFGGCTPSGLDGLFCGPSNGTYTLQGGYWTQLNSPVSPPARYGPAMAYDPTDGYVLMFGGAGASVGGLSDTWSFGHGAWTNRTSSIAPPPDSGGGVMAYDPAIDAMLYYGGDCNATWTYSSGTWDQVNTSGEICPVTQNPAMAFDTSDGYIVLFGGSSAGTPIGTWKFSDNTWTNISSAETVSPSSRTLAVMNYDPAIGAVVLYGGASADFFPNYYTDTWLFSGGQWSNATASAGIAGAPTYGAMTFDPTENDLIDFGGHGLGGDPGSTFAFGVHALQADWPYYVNSLIMDENQSERISTQIYSGGIPYTVTWTDSGLGCSTSTNSSIMCSPTAVGWFNVTALVIDSDSQVVVTQPLSVRINPALLVLVSHPGQVTPGTSFALNATVSGGTPSYIFEYYGLPTGCSAANTTNVSCRVNTTGTYSISFTVRDSADRTINDTYTVTIQAQSSSPLALTPDTELLFLVGVILVVVAVIAVVVIRRHRKDVVEPTTDEPRASQP
jgi:hypothetical protein